MSRRNTKYEQFTGFYGHFLVTCIICLATLFLKIVSFCLKKDLFKILKKKKLIGKFDFPNLANKSYVFKAMYIGETARPFNQRLREHIRAIDNQIMNNPVANHFCSKPHSRSDVKALIIEKIKNDSTMFRKTRERIHIQNFGSKYYGLNKKL